MFGSAVAQRYRPTAGYPIRRLAKDLDLGIEPLGAAVDEPSVEQKTAIGEHVISAIKSAGATLISDSVGGVPGYDGVSVSKTYTPDEIRKHLIGKLETGDVNIPDRPLTVNLHISELYVRTPFLPLVRYGEKDFYHADIREVLGIKLHRMTSKKEFALRDVMDMYNAVSSDAIDLERDSEVLRVIALSKKAQTTLRVENTTLKHLEPTEENIENAMKVMGGHDKQFMREVFETVYDAVRQHIFPPNRSNLPPHLAGPLGLTRNELNFITKIDGVEHLPTGGMRKTDPSIDAALLYSPALDKQFPKLLENIAGQHELAQRLAAARRDSAFVDF